MMNKKEKAAFDQLQFEVLKAKAFRFTASVAADVFPPLAGAEVVSGYVYNTYNGRVDIACSSMVGHGIGSATRTTSQRGIALYSTELLAYRGMRAALEQEMATRLAKIDMKIEELQK